MLTHWGRMTHICVSKLTIIGSDNGLSPGRRQAIIWTNAGILLIWPLGTSFSKLSIDIQTFSFKKIHFKMSSGIWRPFCLGLNVLKGLILTWISQILSWSWRPACTVVSAPAGTCRFPTRHWGAVVAKITVETIVRVHRSCHIGVRARGAGCGFKGTWKID